MTYEVIPNGHVTSPRGFLAGSVHTGVKKEKDDLVLLISETATTSAAMFTQNLAAAAPVHISREVFDLGDVRAVLVNSGNANACTGSRGEADALELQQITAEMMKLKPQQVALASTGVIGVTLPMDKIRAGIPKVIAACHAQGGPQAAQGIMTTDTIRKEMAVTTVIDGKTVTIGGMAKGSGMINPNMATMLGFITTDAAVELGYLKEVVAEVVADTYNMITVDGDTSTNDTVMVLANGQAGNKPLNDQHPDKKKFMDALYAVNEALAISIVKDGEGATKLMEVITEGFATKTDARLAAKAVLNSNLVKTAIFGEDGNWGRIVCSLGYSGASFQLNDVALTLANSQRESVQVLSAGLPLDYSEEKVAGLLKDKKVIIRLTAASGEASARGWGCDLSYDYVKINGSYRS
ncbi:bifunctional glutamate N-acetyltransferase/amino-acid acetyltransferase ArgJ [Anoxynatronum sibiricum]|uniref:Arginine biosynthesis bifunctional protein ArgJ n=1 Tax=Anoxynatronum sibiricum TaxID=210623 RepID=A0ABU9VR35_9CLOT